MKISVSFLMGLLCLCSVSIAQNKAKYKVLNTPQTKVVNKPIFLNVVDTANNDRTIRPVPEYLGGLTPHCPMAYSGEPSYFYPMCFSESGALNPYCVNLLVEINDSILEINSYEKFRAVFAPVESKEEALGFACILNGRRYYSTIPIYDFSFLNDKDADYEFFQYELKPTNVIETSNGYEVNLFTTYWGIPCSSDEITFFVSKDGFVTKLREQYLFNDRNFHEIIE